MEGCLQVGDVDVCFAYTHCFSFLDFPLTFVPVPSVKHGMQPKYSMLQC